VLVDIAGKPMVQRVWERATKARRLAEVIIACDETHVLKACETFGAKAVLTRKDHPSGSDRIAEAVAQSDAEIIVNIQSDEPFVDPDLIDQLVEELAKDRVPVLATPIKRLVSLEELLNPNVVKVVVDRDMNALYFSRSPVPFHRDGEPKDVSGYFRHLGLYAYRCDFLFQYCKLPKSFLEQEEKLEQLRVLEAGYRIKCVVTATETIGVDTPEDVVRAVNFLKAGPNL